MNHLIRMMFAVLVQDQLCTIQRVPVPQVSDREVLIKVHATALNRADTLQRQGKYPLPPGVTDILGLEIAGTVVSKSNSCTLDWREGDQVMALVSGGGYAEYCAVHEEMLMRVPPNLSLIEAAAIPETWLTAYQLLHFVANVKKDDTVLIHAGASGVGVSAIQLCLLAGAKPIVTAGSEEKLKYTRDLGAYAAINRHSNWAELVMEANQGKGVNIILDCVGGTYWRNNADVIAMDGTWVVFGLMGGAEIDGPLFNSILRKRIRLIGTTLRARPLEYKISLTEAFRSNILPLFENGTIHPIVDQELSLLEVQAAHQLMERNENIGKIILRIAGSIQNDQLNSEL